MDTKTPADLEARLARLESEITHLRRRRLGLGAAYVLAVIATVGLSTFGTASALSGSNTVYTDDIVTGNVYSSDVKDGSLTGVDIKSGSLTGTDIKNASVGTADLTFKPLYSTVAVQGASTPVAAGSDASALVNCPPGSRPISGGMTDGNFDVVQEESYPTNTGWEVYARNDSVGEQTFKAFVVCSKNGPDWTTVNTSSTSGSGR